MLEWRNKIVALMVGSAVALAFPMAALAQVKNPGLLVHAADDEPTTLDPAQVEPGEGGETVILQVYDRLLDIGAGSPDLVPSLAVEVPTLANGGISAAGLVYTFKLREGVTFHDGTAFTADDVKYSWDRAMTMDLPEGNAGALSDVIASTEVVDDMTFQVSLSQPSASFLNSIVVAMVASVVSQDAVEANGGVAAGTPNRFMAGDMVGTGPYKFVKWQKGDVVEFARNDDYWGGKPKWSKVVLKPISSAPTRVAAMLAGDVDMIDGVPTADIEVLKKNAKVKLSQGISNRVIYLHMDQQRDNSPFVTDKDGNPMDKNPLKDVRVRKAISMMINRPAIVERVMEGVAIPAGQLVSETFFGNTPKLIPEKYDVAAAKNLLKDAGWGDGFGLTIHGPNNRYINDAKIAEAIAQMLTRGGIPTKVVTMPKNVYFKRASRGGPDKTPEFSFILVGWGSGTGEASSPLKSLLATYDKSKGHGASNRGRHSNPKVDALVEQALATVDDEKRRALLQQATEVGIGESQGIIPLHYQVNTWATRPGLRYDARTDERTLAMDIQIVK